MDSGKLFLRICAVLIALRALTNMSRPFGAGAGLVFFGKFLTGTTNVILAPLLGVYMLVLAYGMWGMRRFALPMAIAYAVFVPINMVLFAVFQGLPQRWGASGYAVFMLVGIALTAGPAWYLARRKAELT
ncbi:MAG TPA: hypothetical protein VL403_00550 [Candidatus Kryptonia bacterium]|nr:hypothetical protein [Candidatus Kryptonia bacterium]